MSRGNLIFAQKCAVFLHLILCSICYHAAFIIFVSCFIFGTFIGTLCYIKWVFLKYSFLKKLLCVHSYSYYQNQNHSICLVLLLYFPSTSLSLSALCTFPIVHPLPLPFPLCPGKRSYQKLCCENSFKCHLPPTELGLFYDRTLQFRNRISLYF